MKPIVAIVALLPSLALAQPLPQPKPPGPGGSLPARLHIVGKLLCAARGRPGRDPVATERQLSVGLDSQRQLLPAQQRWALKTGGTQFEKALEDCRTKTVPLFG